MLFSNQNNIINNDLGILDIVSILSFMLGLDNFRLNEQQSRVLMSELHDTQDEMLRRILAQNEKIIQQNEKLISLLEK